MCVCVCVYVCVWEGGGEEGREGGRESLVARSYASELHVHVHVVSQRGSGVNERPLHVRCFMDYIHASTVIRKEHVKM